MRTAAYVTCDNIEEKTREWLQAVRTKVASRPHLIVRPRECALLVVDMLRYFTHPDGRCFLPASTAIVPNIQALLVAWRQMGGPVAFTRHCHEGPNDLGMLGRFFSDHIRKDEEDSFIIESIAPNLGEPVFEKTTYDAFIGTELFSFLKDRVVEQVLVTGVLTHMCCETTARSAFCRGFEVYLPVDGTASSSEDRHLASLTNMADSVAVVLETKEILKRCDSKK